VSTRIVFNGQTFDSLEAMPPDVRAKYQAVLVALGAGDRAKLEAALGAGALAGPGIKINTTVRTRIRVNGKDYDSVDAMPADVRVVYERALGKKTGEAIVVNTAPSAAMPVPPPAIDAGDSRPGLVRIALLVAAGLAVLLWLLTRR
jgi:hypothetical protein